MPQLLLFDSIGDIMLYHILISFSSFILVPWYGSATQPFPFITEYFRKLPSPNAANFKQPLSLEECLWATFVGKLVYDSQGGMFYDITSISHFNSKVVGLYL